MQFLIILFFVYFSSSLFLFVHILSINVFSFSSAYL
jgi:hypothetical protein